MEQIVYHKFHRLASNYSVLDNVTSPSDLIIAFAILFVLPIPEKKKNCAIFTTDKSTTYQVGLGCPLPGAVDQFTPLEIPELKDKNVKEFCMGPRHAVMLLDDGTAYSWGANDHGQLGHGHDSTFCRPKKIHTDVPFQKIYCAVNATVALSKSGQVYQWGWLNPSSSEKYSAPHKCGGRGEHLYVGAHHAGVTRGNKLYVWGLGSGGRLGLGNPEDVSCDKPKHIKTRVSDVAMSARSTAIINEKSGDVEVFGKNYGHLVIKKGPYTPNIMTPSKVKHLDDVDTIASSWTDDFYIASFEDGTQMIFGDRVAIDDPEADIESEKTSKGSPPKELENHHFN